MHFTLYTKLISYLEISNTLLMYCLFTIHSAMVDHTGQPLSSDCWLVYYAKRSTVHYTGIYSVSMYISRACGQLHVFIPATIDIAADGDIAVLQVKV